DVQVGVADAGGGDLDADLAALGAGQVDVGELDGGGGVSEDDGFHTVPWLGDGCVECYESPGTAVTAKKCDSNADLRHFVHSCDGVRRAVDRGLPGGGALGG